MCSPATPLRILVVEDECLIAFDLAELLAEFGYEVCAIARSAEEAIAAADRLRPDLAVIDVRLAGDSNGLEAAKRIRAEFGVPSCFLSGSIDADLMSEAEDSAPVGFLTKPLQPRLLKAMLARAARARDAA